MGWRFRKSIKLGGGFRVNISRSGVGYSWGIPGYRVTKKAGGGIRQTTSILAQVEYQSYDNSLTERIHGAFAGQDSIDLWCKGRLRLF